MLNQEEIKKDFEKNEMLSAFFIHDREDYINNSGAIYSYRNGNGHNTLNYYSSHPNEWYFDDIVKDYITTKCHENNFKSNNLFLNLETISYNKAVAKLPEYFNDEFLSKTNLCLIQRRQLNFSDATANNLNMYINWLNDENQKNNVFYRNAESIRVPINLGNNEGGVHKGSHYITMVIHPKTNEIVIYDGLGNNNGSSKESFNRTLNQLVQNFNNSNSKKLTVRFIGGFQKDGHNCGPYMCEVMTNPDLSQLTPKYLKGKGPDLRREQLETVNPNGNHLNQVKNNLRNAEQILTDKISNIHSSEKKIVEHNGLPEDESKQIEHRQNNKKKNNNKLKGGIASLVIGAVFLLIAILVGIFTGAPIAIVLAIPAVVGIATGAGLLAKHNKAKKKQIKLNSENQQSNKSDQQVYNVPARDKTHLDEFKSKENNLSQGNFRL